MAESPSSSFDLAHHQGYLLHPNKKSIGLDPIFRSCVKMKVKELQNLKLVDFEDSDHPDGKIELYSFMGHAVNKVEVLGIIVMTESKDKRNLFAVDDGTGVILCIQWKSKKKTSETELSAEDLPASLKQKYQDLQAFTQSKVQGYALGDLVVVRGWVSSFKDQREVVVLDCRLINNPCVEYEAILDYPSLYKVYEQRFIPPVALTEKLNSFSVNTFNEFTVQDAILRYIQDSSCSKALVTLQDILVWSTVEAIISESKENQVKTTAEYMNLIKLAMQVLETSKGRVYRLAGPEDTYEIIQSGCPMAVRVMSLLKMSCQTDTENGCHIRQLKTQLTRYQEYSRVQDPVITYLISCLETSSDVICISPHRYIPMS